MILERRSGKDRRNVSVGAFWRGALTPRRRGGRRAEDQDHPVVDWHSPRVLAVVIAILGLCVLDGVFTVILISHGATELNPLLAPFLPHDLGWFAAVKLGLTSLGVAVLVACNRLRVFRAIPGEAFLYLVLAAYLTLIDYQLDMLALAPAGG